MDEKALAKVIHDAIMSLGLASPKHPKVAKLPKGMKRCRCRMPIPRDWLLCASCTQWEEDDWREGGPKRRKVMVEVIKQCNA